MTKMLGRVTLVIAGILLFTAGFKTAALFVAGITLLWLFFGLVGERWRMFKYRDEFRECTAAVLADSEAMANEVNARSVNFFVHKSFRMNSSRDGLKLGNVLSVRERPRSKDLDGGCADMGVTSFM